jgi:tetratricopeptide (TPR) repeat protein
MAQLGHRIKESFWSQLWNSVRPPPPVPGQRKRLNRSQRRLLGGTFAALIFVVAGAGVYQYLASAEERAGAAFDQGMERMNPGHYEDAIRQFTRAVEIWPQHAQAYFERGSAHQILNQPDAALRDFEMAVQIDANFAPAHTAMGIIYVERTDLPQAQNEFDQSIRIQPTIDGYYQRGQVRLGLAQLQPAIDDFNRAIALGRNVPYLYLARASARSGMGDAAGADDDRQMAASLQKGR